MTTSKPTQVSARDVAAFILEREGPMTVLKLQKLVYYAQAWALAWNQRPLFDEPIVAAEMGPVVQSLSAAAPFDVLGAIEGAPQKLDVEARKTIEQVVRFYARHDGEWLSAITHREAPYANAARGDEISRASMQKFFGSFPIDKATGLPESLERGYELLMSVGEKEQHLLDDDGGEYDPEEMDAWLHTGTGRVGFLD